MKFTAQCIHNIGQQDGIKLVLLQECRPLGLLGCVPCKGVSQPEGHRDWHGHFAALKGCANSAAHLHRVKRGVIQ